MRRGGQDQTGSKDRRWCDFSVQPLRAPKLRAVARGISDDPRDGQGNNLVLTRRRYHQRRSPGNRYRPIALPNNTPAGAVNRQQLRKALLGVTLVQLNDSRAAIRELRAANRLNPAHADARKLLATEYTGNRQFKEAVALLEPVVNQTPYDEETHLLLIGARQSSGDSAGSFELATRAARRFPRSPQVAAWLGFQLQFTGRYEEAQGYLRKAIGLDAAYPVPYQLLGEVFLKQENYAEAVSWFRKAAERMPEDVETLLGLGRALAETGDAAGGLEVLRGAARIAPDNAQVRLQLSRLYFRMGDEENARKEADLSVKLRTPGPNLVEAPAALRIPK